MSRRRAVEKRAWRGVSAVSLCVVGGWVVSAHAGGAAPIDFERQVKPILTERCTSCHGEKKKKSGLRLDLKQAAFEGADGKLIVPGKSGESALISRITASDPDERMPPEAPPLPAAEVAILKRWIDEGAVWPERAVGPAPESLDHIASPEEKAFWSFRPLAAVEPPEVEGDAWSRTPLDAFVWKGLKSEGLEPAPAADRRALIRRVYFDLWGLPPAPEEVEAFVADKRRDAYERLVDRLLASPHFGERWAQHWLDIVRWAETEGFEYDQTVPDLWRYRDYVIQSVNEDLPFDRFVIEQIAGDERDPGNRRLQIAGGFHRIAAVRRNAGNQEITSSRNEVLTERTDIIGTAFMGLTMGCARCHDHKFDPIRQRDYYQLQAFLAATQSDEAPLVPREEYDVWKQTTESDYKEISKLEKILSGKKGAEAEQLRARILDIESRLPPTPPVIATVVNGEETPIHILKRGDPDKKGPQVGMSGPAVLQWDQKVRPLPAGSANPRTALGRWLVDKRQPLTARVIVNRIWLHHFGRGLVATPNDFGANGMRPSHPELLDFLARELLRNGWRLKPVHRMIVLSAAYQQASRSPIEPRAFAKDPQNALLWRFSRRRLEAEEIRDAMLAAAGVLKEKMGGPGVIVPADPSLIAQLYKPAQWKVTADETEHNRRSIYLLAKRNLRLPLLEVFDQPNAQTPCGRREASTHAPQALELLNGATSNRLAPVFAARVRREAGRAPAAQVERAFRLALGRPPSADERKIALEFLKQQPLEELALAVFNLNGFLYVD